MARIVSLGACLQDIYLVDHDDFVGAKVGEQSIFSKLVIGSNIDIDKVSFEVGGGGINAAVSFARFGHETIYMGNIARDTAGEAVLACLDEENIDSSYTEVVRGNTGCAVILLDAKNGKSTVMTYQGVSKKYSNLNADDLESAAPDWLYVTSLGGDLVALEKFLKKARKLGAQVMLNPGRGELAQPKELLKLLKWVDVLVVNKKEAAKLVPGVLLTELLAHLAVYCSTVIVTDGEMGSIATDSNEIYRLGVYEQVKLRDATGAGDAFGAGFLASFAAGNNFKNSLHYAAANAASVVQKYGAEAGILTGQEELHPMPIQKLKTLSEGETC